MSESDRAVQIVKFGPFEADLGAGLLRKHGLRVKLQDQPFQILTVFLAAPGEIVTRERLRQRLWPEGTFVDFDNSLNAAINKLREALADSADNPRYIETLPRRGYRFVATVERPLAAGNGSGANALGRNEARKTETPAARASLASAAGAPRRFRIRTTAAIVGTVLLVAAISVAQFFLQRAGPRASAAGKEMLAVLPFQNISGDPTQEYFSDGLTEELTAQLSRLQPQRLGIIARSTAMQYKRSPKSLEEIARELGIRYALEGSVRRDAGKFRITAQLVDSTDQTHVWAGTYEHDAKDVLAIQQEVASHVARSLAARLLPGGSAVLARASTSSPEAFESYIQGRFFWSKRSPQGVQKSIQLFQDAVRRDPNYALAYAGLADSYVIWGGRLAGLPPAEAYRKARAAVQKAIALDESLAEAHIVHSAILFDHDWDFAQAEKELQRGLELNPGYAFGHQWNAEFLAATGRYEEAMQAIQRSLALEPFARSGNLVRGQILMYTGRYAEAADQFRKLTEIDSTFLPAYTHLARVSRLQGKEAEWFAAYYKWLVLIDTPAAEIQLYSEAFHRGGMREALHHRLRWLHAQSDKIHDAAYAMARVHAALGEKDAALVWIEKAALRRDDFATHILADPELAALRADARFGTLLRRMGFPLLPKA